MTGQLLLIFILIFAIVPNLGYFSVASFLLLTVFGIFAWIILNNPLTIKGSRLLSPWAIILLFLISTYYYGGLYQDYLTIVLGKLILASFTVFIFIQLIKKRLFSPYPFIIVFLILSILTIVGSPNPKVDTFIILKEAPLKFLSGQNPYTSTYTRMYKEIEPNYYNYLPLSFLYFLPFVIIFKDPRYGIIAAMLATYYIANLLQKNVKSEKYLYSSLLLFAPMSFFMLEHIYLDTIIFFLFILSIYLYKVKRFRLFALVFSSFFLVKQNILILLPLFIKHIINLKRYIIFFLISFIPIIFFFIWSPQRFIWNIISLNQPNSMVTKVAPLEVMNTIPSLIFQITHFSENQMKYIYLVCILIELLIAVWVFQNKKLKLNSKIILILFFGYYLSYHAYFNSYYLILLFLLFDFILLKE